MNIKRCAAFFLSAGLGVLLGAALTRPCLSSAQAQGQHLGLVTASEIRLVDEAGRTRALFSLLRGKPRLMLMDDRGEFRMELGLGPAGEPALWLRDQEGRTRGQLSLAAGGPALRLFDAQGKSRAAVALNQKGEPALIMSDGAGQDRLALWQEKDESGLALADAEGRPRAGFTMKKNDRSTLAFYSPEGKVLWSAPQP
ncbi:MAG: hypothetical protein AB1641_00770 [Thermodesulfobacteriota bacterium]